MATPIGHSLAGYAVHTFFDRQGDVGRRNWIWLAVFMAIAPDLDFVPGFLAGTPALYHQGVSHSLGFALAVSLGAAAICAKRNYFLPVLALCFSAYLSHLVIDFFGPDGRLPYGQPLFWPVSTEHFISPVKIFWGMHHAGSSDASQLEWITGVLSPYNLAAILVEVLVIGPFIFLRHLYRESFGKPVKHVLKT